MGAMAMGSALALVALLAVCSADPVTLACASCRTPTPKTPVPAPPVTSPPVTIPPIHVPPIILPPITLPPLLKPPVTVPPVLTPPVTGPPGFRPPVTGPPVVTPPVTVPPVLGPPGTLPPVPLPPVIGLPPIIGGSPPSTPGQGGCPSPPSPPATTGGNTCPMLKLGSCLDVLGQTIKIGDSAVECCSPLAGLTGLDAALCLCTTITAKLLDMNIVLPIALQLLTSTCGKSIPPGYTCP